jgi:hypothetical protein
MSPRSQASVGAAGGAFRFSTRRMVVTDSMMAGHSATQ